MNYWIFVLGGNDAPTTFLALIEEGNWGFAMKNNTRRNIEALQPRDKIIFYVGGKKGGYLAGEAVLTSSAHAPTRVPIGGPNDMKLDAMVDFEKVDLWGGKRLYLRESSVKNKLDFIVNKKHWEFAVIQSLKCISEIDYNTIKHML
jgi:hypothetical protein